MLLALLLAESDPFFFTFFVWRINDPKCVNLCSPLEGGTELELCRYISLDEATEAPLTKDLLVYSLWLLSTVVGGSSDLHQRIDHNMVQCLVTGCNLEALI